MEQVERCGAGSARRSVEARWRRSTARWRRKARRALRMLSRAVLRLVLGAPAVGELAEAWFGGWHSRSKMSAAQMLYRVVRR